MDAGNVRFWTAIAFANIPIVRWYMDVISRKVKRGKYNGTENNHKLCYRN